MSKTLVVIVGPTGIGKTELSVFIAKKLKSEIISSDSRKFYKQLKIGTAIPKKKYLKSITHHFIGNLNINQFYSVKHFENDVLKILDKIFIKKKVVLMVGGSGLYERAVTIGLDNFPKILPGIRNKLINIKNNKGISFLQKKLKMYDPVYYNKIDINNSNRLIRALEVIFSNKGKKFSSFQKGKIKKRPFKIIKIGLFSSRKTLYLRIEKRVDNMIKKGLLKEARELYKYKNFNSLNTIGYKEIFKYFEGVYDLDKAIKEIKKNTKRYAKRQISWYKRDNSIIWFYNKEKKKNFKLYK